MKNTGRISIILLLAVTQLLTYRLATAATDGYYNLNGTVAAWDGTDADRLKDVSSDYNYAYITTLQVQMNILMTTSLAVY